MPRAGSRPMAAQTVARGEARATHRTREQCPCVCTTLDAVVPRVSQNTCSRKRPQTCPQPLSTPVEAQTTPRLGPACLLSSERESTTSTSEGQGHNRGLAVLPTNLVKAGDWWWPAPASSAARTAPRRSNLQTTTAPSDGPKPCRRLVGHFSIRSDFDGYEHCPPCRALISIAGSSKSLDWGIMFA